MGTALFRSLLSYLLVSITLVGRVLAFHNFTSYLFVYFTGEDHEGGEAISFAVSAPYDPLTWTEIRQGAPILFSNVSTRGVRDPAIIRSHDESKFYIIGTDLKMYKSGMTWDSARRKGSRGLVVWESANLINWSSSRLVEVSPPQAGNTWAPKAIWDPQIQKYHVFWASSLYANNDNYHRGDTYQRILKATTEDFVTFRNGEVYIDTGYSVIDTNVVFDENTMKFYRFSKDERTNGVGVGKSADGKYVFQEQSSNINGPWMTTKTGIGRGSISRGEGPLIFKDVRNSNKWYLFIDEFGGRGYVPFETTNIDRATWKVLPKYTLPRRPRHGSVIPITDDERRRLLSNR